MTMRLHGKRCLIVGGTSGIGWAAGVRFLQEGAQVAVAGLDEPRSHQGVLSMMETTGRSPLSIGCDARDPKQVDDAFAFTLQVFGGLDVLYHVAGGSGRRHGDGSLHDCS